jgi:hypothetical protein
MEHACHVRVIVRHALHKLIVQFVPLTFTFISQLVPLNVQIQLGPFPIIKFARLVLQDVQLAKIFKAVRLALLRIC